jgi:hypothetical protein
MFKNMPSQVARVLALTAGLLAASAVAGAPQALADPGDVGDASLWRTSPKCGQPLNILLIAEGAGVLEFEYRVIGAETTTHKVRPKLQPATPRRVKASISEHNRPIRWRVIAYDTNLPDFIDRGGDIFPLANGGGVEVDPPSSAVDAHCGNDRLAEQ